MTTVTNPPPNCVIGNEQGNFDPQYVWITDIDGLVFMKMTPEDSKDIKTIKDDMALMITFTRLLTNMVNIAQKKKFEEIKNDLDLFDEATFLKSIAEIGTFAKMYQRNYKIRESARGVSVSGALIKGVFSLASAPITFRSVAEKLISSIGDNFQIGFSNKKITDRVGKFIIIIECLAGSWVMKLKYTSTDTTTVSKYTSSSCHSSSSNDISMDLTEYIYILDTATQVDELESIINKIKISNMRILALLTNDNLPVVATPAPRPDPNESK